MNEQHSAGSTEERKLPPDLKEQWLKALRSGKYQQAEGVLRDRNNCHCCLGVLADITDPSKWARDSQESDEAGQECYAYNGQETMLGDRTLRSVHLSSTTAIKLAGMNDDRIPFTQIADWIEANL